MGAGLKMAALLSSGCNGSVSGTPLYRGWYYSDGHCIRAVHAEQNALITLDGISADGAQVL